MQGRFALQSRPVPSELYTAHIQAESVDVNAQYWIQKVAAGPLYRARVEGVEFLDFPPLIADAALAIDRDRSFQRYKLLVGNTTNVATEVTQDETSDRRWRVLLSVG